MIESQLKFDIYVFTWLFPLYATLHFYSTTVFFTAILYTLWIYIFKNQYKLRKIRYKSPLNQYTFVFLGLGLSHNLKIYLVSLWGSLNHKLGTIVPKYTVNLAPTLPATTVKCCSHSQSNNIVRLLLITMDLECRASTCNELVLLSCTTGSVFYQVEIYQAFAGLITSHPHF